MRSIHPQNYIMCPLTPKISSSVYATHITYESSLIKAQNFLMNILQPTELGYKSKMSQAKLSYRFLFDTVSLSYIISISTFVFWPLI